MTCFLQNDHFFVKKKKKKIKNSIKNIHVNDLTLTKFERIEISTEQK